MSVTRTTAAVQYTATAAKADAVALPKSYFNRTRGFRLYIHWMACIYFMYSNTICTYTDIIIS